MMRLGDGTDESHRRMQAAVDEVWPYTHELFDARTRRRRCDPATLRAGVRRRSSTRCWPRRR